MKRVVAILMGGFISILYASCASDPPPMPIAVSPQASPRAAIHNQDGIRFFKEGKLELAREAFEAALIEDPDLAEAHYNLAVTLDTNGSRQEAERHYIEAANLAPGHKVIWDSPALRPYGSPTLLPKKEDLGAETFESPLDNLF